MTALNKQALREHYSPKPVPKCHICGAEMTIQRMSVLRTTYGCTGATYDDKGCHYAEGRSIADDHYAQSHVTVVDLSDPEVLAVLDELEATESKCRELAAENAYLLNGASRELNTSWMFHKTMLGAQAALVCLTHGYQAAAREWLEGTTDEAGAEIPDDISVGELHEWFESNMVSNGGNSGFLTRKEAEVAIRKECPATDAFLAEVRAQGVEMYADNLDSGADDAERDGFDDAVKFLRSEASGVRLFAAQLRKGVQS
jgi:predicted peroxiredoxin